MNARPEVLRNAAALIRDHGLAKGTFCDTTGPSYPSYCTVGALMKAGGYMVDWETKGVRSEINLLLDLLGVDMEGYHQGMEWIAISVWNDEGTRTFVDVVELLEQAAEKEEAAR